MAKAIFDGRQWQVWIKNASKKAPAEERRWMVVNCYDSQAEAETASLKLGRLFKHSAIMVLPIGRRPAIALTRKKRAR